jgi:hypothetical protein
MLYLCEDVGVASCSSHILCSYNLTLRSISSVYPDSVNGQDILLIVSSSSFRLIPSSFVTFLHSGMILDTRSLHPHNAPIALFRSYLALQVVALNVNIDAIVRDIGAIFFMEDGLTCPSMTNTIVVRDCIYNWCAPIWSCASLGGIPSTAIFTVHWFTDIGQSGLWF